MSSFDSKTRQFSERKQQTSWTRSSISIFLRDHSSLQKFSFNLKFLSFENIYLEKLILRNLNYDIFVDFIWKP